MIPSDHFVRYYNEVFKRLNDMGRDHLLRYWREVGRMQTEALAARFREGGLRAVYDYWRRIYEEENCLGKLTLTDDYFEFQMDRCPSLTKVLDNDAAPFPDYCDHCMGWIEPVMEASGLHAVLDMKSRSEPRCVLRVYRDPEKARAFEQTATLPSHPYRENGPGPDRDQSSGKSV